MTLAIDRASSGFPSHERFLLAAQLRRAAVSSCANLVEGYGRLGPKELRRFLGITLGSLTEVDALLLVAKDLGYLDQPTHQSLREHYLAASKATYGLLRAIRRPPM